MLKEQVVERLNEQVSKEMYSSNLYISMSSWCYKHKFDGAGEFLAYHANEESEHAKRLIKYLNETDSVLDLGPISKPENTFSGLLDVFEKTFVHELYITKSINDLVDFTLSNKDYSTFHFLQWYISEQHEEEALFRDIVDKIKLIGCEGSGPYLADQYIRSIIAK